MIDRLRTEEAFLRHVRLRRLGGIATIGCGTKEQITRAEARGCSKRALRIRTTGCGKFCQ